MSANEEQNHQSEPDRRGADMNQETATTKTPGIDPCEHMQERVNALADGSLTGVPSWYTRFHVFHCSRCGAALKNLRTLLHRVHPLKDIAPAEQPSTLTAERRAKLMAAMDSADNEQRRPNQPN